MTDPDAPHMRRIMFADQAMREDGADPRDVARLLRHYADLIERAEIADGDASGGVYMQP